MAQPGPSDRLLTHRWGGSSALRTYAALYAGQRRRLAWSALVYVFKHSPAVLLPVLTGLTIDLLASGAPLEQLWPYALCGALLIAQNVPGHYLHVRLLSRAVREVERELRSALSQRIQQLSIGYYQHRSPATLQAKMLRDVEAIEQMTRALVDGVLGSASAIVVAVVTTAWRAPSFLLVFLVTVPLACWLMLATGQRMSQRNGEFRAAIEEMSARIGEMTQMLPLTRAHGLEQHALGRVGRSLAQVSRTGLAVDSVNAWFGSLGWGSFQALGLACLMGAAWAHHTHVVDITLGDVVLLSAFFSSLTGAMLTLVGMLPVVSKGLESVRSIDELMRTSDLEPNEGKQVVHHVAGHFEFDRLGYRYPGAAQDALHDVTLTVEPGETIALVGPSGSGKSTLANLVIGLLRPTQGRLRFDGHDMQQLDLRTWRRFVSVVPQDCVLFEGSVRDNVTYGLGCVPHEQLMQALQDAQCLEFIERLPQGLDTQVGVEASQLSGGQRQRLAIARALVRNPRVLVLDEASSALDHDSERRLQQALERVRHGRTTFIVAHRLSTVRDADRIVVMDRGHVVDVGPHEALMARCPLYARLVRVSAIDHANETSTDLHATEMDTTS